MNKVSSQSFLASRTMAVIVLLAAATVVLAALPNSEAANPLAEIGFVIVPAVFAVVGFIITTRRPRHAVGWLLLVVGFLFMVVAASSAATPVLRSYGYLSLARVTDLLGALWVPALGITGTHLLLRLPDGKLPSAQWRWYSRAATAVIASTLFLVAGAIRHPFGFLFLLFPLSFVGALASLVQRYRRATGQERLQLRWIALGGAVFLAAYLPVLLSVFGVFHDGTAVASALQTIAFLAFSAIPVSIGIAVLRYRLYEIDRILSGAAVYATLTVTLAAAYFASVLLLQLALSHFTRDSALAVAGSTLAVAALFRPARLRIQDAVDRHFYRARYDARRTVESFVTRLRDEVDLTALDAELRAVVSGAVQPTAVSVWLRSRS